MSGVDLSEGEGTPLPLKAPPNFKPHHELSAPRLNHLADIQHHHTSYLRVHLQSLPDPHHYTTRGIYWMQLH